MLGELDTRDMKEEVAVTFPDWHTEFPHVRLVYRQGKPYEAIAACDRALELDGSAAKGWYRRGQACVALGQYGAAVKDLTKAGQLNPSSREIRAELDAAKARAAEKRQAGVAGMFGAG